VVLYCLPFGIIDWRYFLFPQQLRMLVLNPLFEEMKQEWLPPQDKVESLGE